jgi:hypothetical protein
MITRKSSAYAVVSGGSAAFIAHFGMHCAHCGVDAPAIIGSSAGIDIRIADRSYSGHLLQMIALSTVAHHSKHHSCLETLVQKLTRAPCTLLHIVPSNDLRIIMIKLSVLFTFKYTLS